MNITIRQEEPKDYKEVSEVIEEAFGKEQYSDNEERLLVDRLRKSDAFIPELSLVAEYQNEIVGHILLTKIRIENEEDSFESLALAPVSVKPPYQHTGIGAELIKESHRIARNLGFRAVILVGHAQYYPRFGYELAGKYAIKLPFAVPEENCLVFGLSEKGLNKIYGNVIYPKEFFA